MHKPPLTHPTTKGLGDIPTDMISTCQAMNIPYTSVLNFLYSIFIEIGKKWSIN